MYEPDPLSPFAATSHTNRVLLTAQSSTTAECFDVGGLPTLLEVQKECVPDTDSGHFDVHVDGLDGESGFHETVSVECGGGTGQISVAPGTYTVSETPSADNQHTYPDVTIGGACGTGGDVTLAAGDEKTCVITNARDPSGELTVHKVCDPPTDTGEFDVVIGDLRIPNIPCGGSTGAIALPKPHGDRGIRPQHEPRRLHE